MEMQALGRVASITMGQSPPGDTCSASPLGKPLLNGPTEFGHRHPVPVQWTTAPARLAEPGDLLLCVRGSTTGRMNRADQEYAIGRGVAAIRGEDATDTDYVTFAMQDTLSMLLSITSGSVFPNLSSQDLKLHVIPWPSKDERTRIVSVLRGLDDKVDHNGHLVRQLRDLARAVLERAAGATTHVVGDVADVRKGLSYTSKGLADSGMAMVNLANAENFGWLKRSGFKFYVGDYKARHVASPGSLLVSGVDLTWRLRIIGWPMVLPADLGPMLFSQDIFLVDFRPEHNWLKLPLWAHLYSAEARARIEGMAYGTTVARFPTEALTGMEFPAPAPDDPALGAAETLVERAWVSERETAAIQELRNAIASPLISGELHVGGAGGVMRQAV